MKNKQHIKILFLQDGINCDEKVKHFVEDYVSHNKSPLLGFEFSWYSNILDTIINFDADTYLVIFDYFVSNIVGRSVLTGAHLLDKIKSINPKCKLIILTADHTEIEMLTAHQKCKKAIFITKNNRFRSQLSRALNHFLKDQPIN